MAGQYSPIIISSVYEHNKEADSDGNPHASLLPSSLMTLDMLHGEPQLPLSQVDLLIKISPPYEATYITVIYRMSSRIANVYPIHEI